jgi:23S rRNA (guanosine2251-2'-O)-methyltransferase
MKPPHSGRPGGRGPGKGSDSPRPPRDARPPGRDSRPPARDASHRNPPASKRGEAPRKYADRPQGGRAQVERPYSERPRTERTLSIRPPADRAGADKARERPIAEKPRERQPTEKYRRPSAPQRPADPDAPRGALWLYGIHAVAAALANPARRLRRLLLTEEAEAALSAVARPPWPIAVERADRARLDQLLGRDMVHQGVALLADPLSPPALATVMERPGTLLVLDQVSDPRNIGAILRTAAAFGVAAVIVQDRNSPEETGTLAKAASGAMETVPLLRAVNIARTIVALKAAGCWVVGLDAKGAKLSGAALAERRVALVLGSEGEGMRRLTRETCDELAGIAMPGGGQGLDSLNVSAAAAVALYELGRR